MQRVALFAIIVVGLLLGLVALNRGRLNVHNGGVRASMEAAPAEQAPPDNQPPTVRRQPTILHARRETIEDHGQVERSPNSQEWRQPGALISGQPALELNPVVPVPSQSSRPTSVPTPARPDARPPLPRGLPENSADSFRQNRPAPEATGHFEGATAVSQKPVTYLTEADDSFWQISHLRYGVGDYYLALFAHNRDRVGRPDRLQAGVVLSTPAIAELRRLYPDLCPPP